MRCSIPNAHGHTAKYWTVGPVGPRVGVGISYFERLILVLRYETVINQRSPLKYYETTSLPPYCIENSVRTSMANVATTYTHQGQGEAAEELQTGANEDFKRKFEADYPDTLASIRALALTLKEQGRDEEAIRLMHQQFSSLTCSLVSNHPHTLSPSETLIY